MNKARHLLRSTPLAVRIGALYVVLGGVLFTGGTWLASMTPVVYATEAPIEQQTVAKEIIKESPEIQGIPTRLKIERLGMNLAVLQGNYDPETLAWTLSDTDAFYATPSQQPGTKPGTTLIYGHNRVDAFAPLAAVGQGEVVELTLEDGTRLSYTYSHDARITPEATSILTERSLYPQLVLMTCDGMFNEVRRVMYFTLGGITT